jgi:hypothetical protein
VDYLTKLAVIHEEKKENDQKMVHVNVKEVIMSGDLEVTWIGR